MWSSFHQMHIFSMFYFSSLEYLVLTNYYSAHYLSIILKKIVIFFTRYSIKQTHFFCSAASNFLEFKLSYSMSYTQPVQQQIRQKTEKIIGCYNSTFCRLEAWLGFWTNLGFKIFFLNESTLFIFLTYLDAYKYDTRSNLS